MNMNKITLFVFILSYYVGVSQSQNEIFTKLGQVSFFSYTSVENIEAVNNYAASSIDLNSGNIDVLMLMNTFEFKKALMKEHFNESYVESDIYPRSSFSGKIVDFDASLSERQTRIIKGKLSLHGVTKEIEFKADIDNLNGNYTVTGEFEAGVSDYQIKIPPLLAGNIAKTIKVTFKFEYEQYE